jgi:hypothetical protein
METHKLSEQFVIICVEAFLQQGRRLSSHQKFPISNEYCTHTVFSVLLLLFFRSSKYFTYALFQSHTLCVLSLGSVTKFT